MKIFKLILILSLILQVPSIMGQKLEEHVKYLNRYKFCDPFASLIDSVHTFKWTNENWEPDQIWIYYHNKRGFYTKYLLIDANTRNYIARSTFTYNKYDQVTLWVYELFVENTWTLTSKRESFFDENKLLYQDKFYRWTDNAWKIYQILTYEYENERLVNYKLTWFDEQSQSYDHGYNYYLYDSQGLLTERFEQRLSDNKVYWRQYYNYNDFGLQEERITQVLGFDPVINDIGLVNYTRESYEYDEFGLLDVVYRDRWVTDKWEKQQKRVYFDGVSKKTKVMVCHNGRSICISINALQAHLRHGDYLGECKDTQWGSDDKWKKNEDGKKYKEKNDERDSTNWKRFLSESINIFPNPVKGHFTIESLFPGTVISRIELYDSMGNLRKSIIPGFSQSIQIDSTGLPDGIYLVKITADKETVTRKLIFK